MGNAETKIAQTDAIITRNDDSERGLAIDERSTVREVLSTPELASYHEEYNRLPHDIKNRLTWDALQNRLIENNAEKLNKAKSLRGGGQLFGIDKNGKALFKDKGAEPIMYGRTGSNIEEIIRSEDGNEDAISEYLNYYEIREEVKKEGYELFPYKKTKRNIFNQLSDEIKQAQAHTNEILVGSNDRKKIRAIWLESGDLEPDREGGTPLAHIAEFDPKLNKVSISWKAADKRPSHCGAIRLLRV